MDIANLLAQGVQIRPAGMEQNALMQAQQFQDSRLKNALMQYQLESAKRADETATQNALMLKQWREGLQMPQGQQEFQPGRPAMNAAQAESAAMTPGYGVSSAQDQWKQGAPDPRMAAYVQAAKAGQMAPADFIKAMYPDRKMSHAPAGSMIFDERTGAQVAQVPDKAATDTADWKDYQKAVAQGFKGQFIDYQREMANLKAPKIVNDINGGQKGFENEAALRKEFDNLPEVKNYKQAYPAFAAIKDAASRNTPQADINLVYGIAKLYDPNSVVREGEYSTVANSPSIPERIKGYAQYIAGGGKLSPDTKAQILAEAQGRLKSYEAEYQKSRTTYEGVVRSYGFAPERIFANIGNLTPLQQDGDPKKGPLSSDEQAELAALRKRFKGK